MPRLPWAGRAAAPAGGFLGRPGPAGPGRRARSLSTSPSGTAAEIALAQLGRNSEAEVEQALAARLRAELDELLRAQARLVGSPRDLDSQRQVMRWMFTHGKGPEGVRWAEAILRDHPDEPETCRMLAEHYEKAGQAGLANLYRARSAPSPAP